MLALSEGVVFARFPSACPAVMARIAWPLPGHAYALQAHRIPRRRKDLAWYAYDLNLELCRATPSGAARSNVTLEVLSARAVIAARSRS
jgi:hypothetical protein